MWKVIVRREVRPLIDALNGRKTGYPAVYEQLRRDPCAEFETSRGGTRPFAYRLSGALGTKVGGVHLKRGYRLAFTMRPADDEHARLAATAFRPRSTKTSWRSSWTGCDDSSAGGSNPQTHQSTAERAQPNLHPARLALGPERS